MKQFVTLKSLSDLSCTYTAWKLNVFVVTQRLLLHRVYNCSHESTSKSIFTFSFCLLCVHIVTLVREYAGVDHHTPVPLVSLFLCLRLCVCVCVCSHETTGFWLKRNNLCSDSRDTQQTPLKLRWPAISRCLSYTHTHAQAHKVTHEREETSCLERFDLQSSARFSFTLTWVCVPPEDICALFSAVFAIFVSFLRFEIPTLSPSLSLCTTHLIKQQSPFGCGFNSVSQNAHFQVIMPAFLLETSSVSKMQTRYPLTSVPCWMNTGCWGCFSRWLVLTFVRQETLVWSGDLTKWHYLTC